MNAPESPAPLISILIPAFGLGHLLGDALHSLQAQTCADWEAVVVDDGCPVGIEQAVAPFVADRRIRVLNTAHGGVSAARNRAAAAARAPWISLLDADDCYEPAYVARMMAMINHHPEFDFFTCDATYFGDGRSGKLFSTFNPQNFPLTLSSVIRRDFNIFVGCTIRKASFEAVGGFDPSLQCAEDLDLWLRFLLLGHKGGLVNDPLVRYRRRSGSLSSDNRRMNAATQLVYRNLVDRLLDEEDIEAANAQIRRAEKEETWRRGEELILAGDTRSGLDMLADAGGRSGRWRYAIPVMRLCPWLAKHLLRMRSIIPEPSVRHAASFASSEMGTDP